jgi:hypothetical protein
MGSRSEAQLRNAALLKPLADALEILRRYLVRPGLPADISTMERSMNNIIYVVGLVVIVMAVLAFFGLR